MAIDPAALNALTQQYAVARADLDDNENRAKINYNTLLDRMRRQNIENKGTLAVGMADRGLTHSGIAAQANLKLQDEYNRALGEQNQLQNTNLATIARKRLEADQALQANTALLQSQSIYDQMGIK